MSMAGRVWTISGSCPINVPCCAVGLKRKSGTRRRRQRFALRCIRARRCGDTAAKTGPEVQRQQAQSDDQKLARDEPKEPFECSLSETVGIQPDFEHVHGEPR